MHSLVIVDELSHVIVHRFRSENAKRVNYMINCIDTECHYFSQLDIQRMCIYIITRLTRMILLNENWRRSNFDEIGKPRNGYKQT